MQRTDTRQRLAAALAVGLAGAGVGVLATATHLATIWVLLGLWVLGTLIGITYVLARSRAERRPPTVRMLFGRRRF